MTENKIVKYMFNNSELKYWEEDKNGCVTSEIWTLDLNEFVDWESVNNEGFSVVKEGYKSDTKFINVNDRDENK